MQIIALFDIFKNKGILFFVYVANRDDIIKKGERKPNLKQASKVNPEIIQKIRVRVQNLLTLKKA